MTKKFEASNGVEVHIDEFSRLCIGRGVPEEHTQAAREFFRHERDEELGRWRSSIHPSWTAVEDGRVYRFTNDDGKRGFDVHKEDRSYTGWLGELREVAKEYLAAHPISKPWHDAKRGEVWEVTVSPSLATANVPAREPHPMQVMLDDSGPIRTLFFVYWNGPDAETVDIEDLEIDTARRLWPEASND